VGGTLRCNYFLEAVQSVTAFCPPLRRDVRQLHMSNFYKEHIPKVLEYISKLIQSKLIIGIDGLGGSGKSTFAKELLVFMPDAIIVHMDDFYKPKVLRDASNTNSEVGAFFDWQRLEKQLLIPFIENREILIQKYDWESDYLKNWQSIPNATNVIIEGVYSTRKELLKYYNLKIWIDCPAEIRLLRGIERDGIEIKEYWQNVWMKQEEDYYKKHKPFLSSDVKIDGYND